MKPSIFPALLGTADVRLCAFELLEEDDPIAAWRERMLDLFGGLARAVPAARASETRAIGA